MYERIYMIFGRAKSSACAKNLTTSVLLYSLLQRPDSTTSLGQIEFPCKHYLHCSCPTTGHSPIHLFNCSPQALQLMIQKSLSIVPSPISCSKDRLDGNCAVHFPPGQSLGNAGMASTREFVTYFSWKIVASRRAIWLAELW